MSKGKTKKVKPQTQKPVTKQKKKKKNYGDKMANMYGNLDL